MTAPIVSDTPSGTSSPSATPAGPTVTVTAAPRVTVTPSATTTACPAGSVPGQLPGECLGDQPSNCWVSAAYCASLDRSTPPVHPRTAVPSSVRHTSTHRPVVVTTHAVRVVGVPAGRQLANTGPADAVGLASVGLSAVLVGTVLLAGARRGGKHS